MLPSSFVLFALALVRSTQSNAHILVEENSTSWPALAFRFVIKRSTMAIHGSSDFTVVACPAFTRSDEGIDSILYNTFTTFIDDARVYNYTVVNGSAYVSSSSLAESNASKVKVACDDTEEMPPINAIVSALNKAIPVSGTLSSSNEAIECLNGAFKASVNGIHFRVCVADSSGLAMSTSDMEIHVTYLASHGQINKPNTHCVCEKTALPTPVTTIGRALLTGLPAPYDRRQLKGLLGNYDFSRHDRPCTCKSTPRPCVFLHGLRINREKVKDADAFSKIYWGNMTHHAPCCSSMKFIMLNTLNTSWTDAAQQQEVCDRILEGNEASHENVIANTIIVAHSMGNLLLAGAIANTKCRMASSSTWVGMSGPMRGSMLSLYFQESCKNRTNSIMEDAVLNSGLCYAPDGILSLAYEGERYSSPELDAAYRAAQKVYQSNVSALMCSNGFSGLPSKQRWYLWVLGTVVPHHSFKNDGMVEFLSCAGGIPIAKFGNSYEDKFYVTKLNHVDTAFRNGDALFNKAKMPVKWFECLL